MRRPIMRLAYWTGMRRWACSTKTTNTTIARPSSSTSVKTTPPAACRIPVPCEGRRAAIEVNISSDMPLPTPRLVMSSPSHMISAVPAVMVMTMTAMLYIEGSRMMCGRAARDQPVRAGERDDAGGLQDRERHGQVARVLGDLGFAGAALLAKLLEPRDHDRQQLNDDAAVMYGRMPSAKTESCSSAPPLNRLISERTFLLRCLIARQAVVNGARRDPRGRQHAADPEQNNDAEREQQLLAQVRRAERPSEGGEHGSSLQESRRLQRAAAQLERQGCLGRL